MTVNAVITKIKTILGIRRDLSKILGVFDKAERELKVFISDSEATIDVNQAHINKLKTENDSLNTGKRRANSVLKKINDLTSSGRESNPDFQG